MIVNLLYSVVVVGICSALVGVGCSSTPHVQRALVNPKAAVHTVDYNAGYTAGCASGRNAVGDADYRFSKDTTKYAVNHEYSTGWDEGYAMCQEEYLVEVQNKVKQDIDLSSPDQGTTTLRQKIWNDLKK